MRKLLVVALVLIHTISFSQEEFDCDLAIELFEELSVHHEELVLEYSYKIENNQKLKKQNLKNPSVFTGNYLNFFINNTESIELTNKLRRHEKDVLKCIENEQVKYDLKAQFTDSKESVKEKLSQEYHKPIDELFKNILKKVKLQ